MGDLILETKLHTLKRNLMQVSKIFILIDKYRNNLQEMEDLLGGQSTESIGVQVTLISELIHASTERLRNSIAHDKHDKNKVYLNVDLYNEVLDKLDRAKISLDNLNTLRENVRDNIMSMEGRLVSIEGEARRSLNDDLVETAENWIKGLQNIIDDLEKAKGENTKLSEKAWESYAQMLSGHSPLHVHLFSDYVDLLGGLAIRDRGFIDDGICQIADELMSTFKMMLSIPGKQDSTCMTLKGVLHMGFPEWTIWALPFAAHEFWRVILGESSEFRNFVEYKVQYLLSENMGDHALSDLERLKSMMAIRDKKQAQDYQLLQDLLGDAFATLVMGPAYACAAILLRLDPLSAISKDGIPNADAKRAYVIFATLKKMNDKTNGEEPYVYLLDRLEDEWCDTLKRANKVCMLSMQHDDLDCLVTIMDLFLTKQKPDQLVYTKDSWNNVKRLIEPICNDKSKSVYDIPNDDGLKKRIGKIAEANETEIDTLKGTENLRDILNAAWLCRIHYSSNKIDDIAEAFCSMGKELKIMQAEQRRTSKLRNDRSTLVR